MDIIKTIEDREAGEKVPDFGPGDTVKVAVKVKEGDKERIQIFQGVVISRKAGGTRESFTVRKVSGGIGVERIFPLHSPTVGTVEIVQRGKTRRAKLYYMKERKGKAARIRAIREKPVGGEVTEA
jgi:large subunit ribosomal protein L19